MRRYTINELSGLTNKQFAVQVLQDELNARANPYSPVADKLKSAIYELENADRPNSVTEYIHVMSVNEVFGVDSDGLVYVETFSGCITPGLVTDQTRTNNFTDATERFIAAQQMKGAWLPEENYGVTWRCWNRRPTYELCVATPWENKPAENKEKD